MKIIDNDLILKIYNSFDTEIMRIHENESASNIKLTTADWTNAVLSSFVNIGKSFDFTCHVNPLLGTGEYLFDLCWTTYPKYPDDSDKIHYYTNVNTFIDNPPQIILSLESEWGIVNNHRQSKAMILNDFCKIRDAKSQIKVMFFAYHEQNIAEFNELINFMKILMKHPYYNLNKEYFLLYGISWEDNKNWDKMRKAAAYSVLNSEITRVFENLT